jgi:hypothetical protein
MPYFRGRPSIVWGFPFLILLGGCGAKPECDTFETRNAVLKIVSDDHSNHLATYAAKKSTQDNDGKQLNEKPLYTLGEKIVTTSTSEDKRTLKCSGSISVTVGDTKASKEVDFTVQRATSGEMSVSVAPFQF